MLFSVVSPSMLSSSLCFSSSGIRVSGFRWKNPLRLDRRETCDIQQTNPYTTSNPAVFRPTVLNEMAMHLMQGRCRLYLCSQEGNRKSSILMMTAEPATPTTTTHMIKKKSGIESDQKRLSFSLSPSTHWHATCPHTITIHEENDTIEKQNVFFFKWEN